MMLHLTRDNCNNLSCTYQHEGRKLRLILSRFTDSLAVALRPSGEFMIVKRVTDGVWAVAPVLSGHRLVDHDGWEMAGSMCCTTAYVRAEKLTITPGPLNNMLVCADNVNGRDQHVALTPGKCYLLGRDTRCQGVPDFTYIKPCRLA